MQPFHVTIATRGRITLFPTPEALVGAARGLSRVLGDRLLLFNILDDHAHVVVHATPDEIGYVAASVNRALGGAGAPPRQRAHIEPVEGRTHLKRLVGYTARQVTRHGLTSHPSTWEGSSAPDLLGVRRLPGYDVRRIHEALPRTSIQGEVMAACEVWKGALSPASDEAIATLPPDALLALSLAACGASGGRDPVSVTARSAWARLCPGSPSEIGPAAQVPERTVRSLRERRVPEVVLTTIRRRVALTSWIATLATP
jgi:hypothetical protein